MSREFITKEDVDKIEAIAEAETYGCEVLVMPKMTDEELKRFRDCIDSEQSIRIEPDSPVRPLPCVRDENGEIKHQNIKMLYAKINEELDEFKSTVNGWRWYIATEDRTAELESSWKDDIAEEAADTITAITTMLEVLGINVDMRDEAQRRVNEKNRERGRL